MQHDEETPNCKIVVKEVGGQYFPCIERLPGAQGAVPRCNLKALGEDIHRKLPRMALLLLRNVPMEEEIDAGTSFCCLIDSPKKSSNVANLYENFESPSDNDD